MVRTIRSIVSVLAALAVAALVSGPLVAQRGGGGGKPKPPSSHPGTAEFRCNVGDTCDAGAFADGLLGDGSNYAGLGEPESGSGAHLRTSNGELWLGFRGGINALTLDFRGQVGSCGEACEWDWVNDNRYTPNEDYYEIQSNVVDGDGNEIDNGLLGIPVGESRWARFNIGIFEDPNGRGYVLNFNRANPSVPGGDNGSREVVVIRISPCTWIFNDDDHQAFMKSGVRKGRVDEGLFFMPFELTFTASGGC